MRGLARFDLGDLDGLEDLREALEFGIRLGLGRVTAVTYSNLAEELQLAEGPGAALECYREGLDLCRKRGMAGMAMALQSNMLECLFDLGDWDELLTIADDVLAWYKPQGGGYDVVSTEAQKARLHVLRGELAAAAVLVEDFLPRARLVGELQVLIAAFPVAALLAQARGDSLAAIQLVGELNEATKDHPAKYRALPLPDLTRICVSAGHLPLAERLLEDIDVPIARVQHCLVTAQAVVTEARGALGQAGDLYEDAAERWSDNGSLPERGQALLGLGRCLVQLGHPDGRTRLVEALLLHPWVRLGASGQRRTQPAEGEHGQADQRLRRLEPERDAGQQAQLGVDRLHSSVGGAVQQTGHDRVAVDGDRTGQGDERGDAATPRP
jgi:tetratricopeptide (TPR) repeat protein